jgi:hypothetical protein
MAQVLFNSESRVKEMALFYTASLQAQQIRFHKSILRSNEQVRVLLLF